MYYHKHECSHRTDYMPLMIGYNFNVDIAMLAFVPGNFMATVALWDKQCCPHLQ